VIELAVRIRVRVMVGARVRDTYTKLPGMKRLGYEMFGSSGWVHEIVSGNLQWAPSL